jgi:holo-[acyl-carrier protein] synthase
MIVGNGIDIVDVLRIAEKVKRKEFRDKVFALGEIGYCEKSAHPSESYAARFAAKEAFLKATGKGLTWGYELNEIEIVSDDNGKPSIVLHGNIKSFFEMNRWSSVHVSLSHIQSMACAVVTIEK